MSITTVDVANAKRFCFNLLWNLDFGLNLSTIGSLVMLFTFLLML